MDTATYAKLQMEQAFNLMGMATDGLDDVQYNWAPGGTCNSIARSHVHAVSSTDFFVNVIAQGKPLLWPDHGPQAGLPAHPMEIWSFTGAVPMAAVAEYARHVRQAALDFVSSLNESDFDREVDTQFFGKQSLAWVVQLAAWHTTGHAGDVSAVKGMQGLKGLPF